MAAKVTDRQWMDMSPDEKLTTRLERWRNPQAIFSTEQAAADHRARVDRVISALMLEQPDRVPVMLSVGFWPAVRKGISPAAAMRDAAAASRAAVDFTLEYQPDIMVDPAVAAMPASVYEAIDFQLYRWPGHGVPDHAGYQYVENEWMLPEEYGQLIADPSDYMLHTYLPRAVGAFRGFSSLSSLFHFIEFPFVLGNLGVWGSPEVTAGLDALARASRELGSWAEVVGAERTGLMASGYPTWGSGGTKAPFDILGDTLRGTKGVLVDMFRRPDEVIAACERLVPVALDLALRHSDSFATPIVGIPLHKGAEGFMSDEQFHRFYWPTLKAVLLGIIEQGCIPALFAEGRYGARLEAIMDLPKARTAWMFDQTDMARAKRTIGQVACIQGNVPLSLIHAGEPPQMTEYVRKLMADAGSGGGFILTMGAVADDGREENLRAMIDAARRYGVY
jgi:hypothetical protein